MNGNNEDHQFFSNIYNYPSHTYSLNKKKQNSNSFAEDDVQSFDDKTRDYNESIFSFRYLNKIRNNDNYKKCNNNFFKTEYKHMIENIKDSQPDIYFKHKLDEIKTNIDGLQIKYKKSERMSKIASEKNILHKNKSATIHSIYFFSVILILISVAFYLFYKLNLLQVSLDIFISRSHSSICFFFVIACLILILILTNKYSHSTNLRFKLIAEKCIKDLEMILANNEEGSLVEVEQFSRLYCRDNNIVREDFEKSILLIIKQFINLDKTNLCEVNINNQSYFKFKT